MFFDGVQTYLSIKVDSSWREQEVPRDHWREVVRAWRSQVVGKAVVESRHDDLMMVREYRLVGFCPI